MRAAAAVSSRGEPGKPAVKTLNGADEVRAIAAATRRRIDASRDEGADRHVGQHDAS